MSKPVTCKVCNHKFHFGEEVRRDHWSENKMYCPACKQTYCCLPETERVLRTYQDSYYASGKDEKWMTKIYETLVSYSRSLILKSFSNVIHSQEQLQYHAHNSTSLVIEDYFRKDHDFYILTSFGGFLIRKIKQSIWSKSEYAFEDISINRELRNGRNFQVADKKDVLKEIEIEEDTNLLLDHSISMLLGIKQYCETAEENYIRLLNVLLFLKKGETQTDKFFLLYGRKGKEVFNKTLVFFRQQLHERAQA